MTLRWLYLLACILVLVSAALAITGLLDMVERHNTALSALHAGASTPPDRDAHLSQLTVRVQGFSDLLNQHIQHLKLLVALVAVFVTVIGFFFTDYLRKHSRIDIADFKDSIRKECMSEIGKLGNELRSSVSALAREASEISGVAVRFMEFQLAKDDGNRLRILTTASAMRKKEFIGIWKQMLSNTELDSRIRSVAIDAMGNFAGTPAASVSSCTLADTLRFMLLHDHRGPASLIVKGIDTIGNLGQFSGSVEAALAIAVCHDNPEIKDSAKRAVEVLRRS
jgi:hypothetical protein